MRTIVIGDIHGELNLLRALITKLQPQADDVLIFVGDYIDRGPDSKGVIDFLLELKHIHSCVFLRGNHEEMLLSSFNSGDQEVYDWWFRNGGLATLVSYQDESIIGMDIAPPSLVPESHMSFIRNTRLLHLLQDHNTVVTHAGFESDEAISTQLVKKDVWIRSHWEQVFSGENPDSFPWEMRVICGHTILQEPYRSEKLIGIDLGSFKTGKLCAYLVEEDRFVIAEVA